ncbi:polysaccharide biosynthesis tyrosine autokinase [Pararhodobacter oceanensis]|uniref:Acetyltransferase n=1 Tax=Pararhodobacter oceanensis TaxID=2172121 RepID=A0A2T8HSE4_9RHOB|nr:polysaccharide biosynthesis tyrosine autokinase [Pararhodobacter oceanensis]PVH28242.1 acetyltransferase [Pararhodobacter oceanensis]
MSSTTQAPEDDEIDLLQLLLTIWKGKLTVAVFALLALVAGAFYLASTPPTYQADALLQLEERSGQLALPEAMQGLVDNSPQSATEIELLRSRLVLGRVVAELNLDWRVEPVKAPLIGNILARYALPIPEFGPMAVYARAGEGLTLGLLSVPPSWINREILLEVTEGGYRLTLPGEQEVSGTVGQMLAIEAENFAINVDTLVAPPGREYTITQIDELRAISSLRSNLTVSERGRGSGVLEVRFAGGDRALNARILNAVTQSYVQQNIARSAAEAQSSLEFINTQLPQAEAALRQAETALNDYRQRQVAIDLTFETQNILSQINAFEAQIAELQRREDEISQRYTPSHPVYRQLLEERERLEARMADLRVQAGNLPETQREVLNLTRNVELAQRIYTELLTRQQEVEVLRASTVGNVRIVDTAASAPLPIAPRKSMVMALSLILGAMLGIAVVLVRSWLHKGIQDSTEIEKLGLPVFATINYSAAADSHESRRNLPGILAIKDPTDLSVEAFRSLRTSLHFGMLDADSRSLALTSPHPGAGKTFSAVNLAATAAQSGQKICLIDADMRRGYLHRYFGVERSHLGLADILAGDADIESCLVQGPLPDLYFIPTGKYPPNPSELLMRDSFNQLIKSLDEHFDLTILDCPPILAVTDPVIISRAAGTTILVARHNVTPLGEIDASMKAFDAAGAKLNGAILNGFDPKKAKGGYGYGYGYGYRYQYKQRED